MNNNLTAVNIDFKDSRIKALFLFILLLQAKPLASQGYLTYPQFTTIYTASVLSQIGPAVTTSLQTDAIIFNQCKEDINTSIRNLKIQLAAAPANSVALKGELDAFRADSLNLALFLDNHLVGRQNYTSFDYAIFQNYTGVFDDNPKNITQTRFSYSFPIHKTAGFIIKPALGSRRNSQFVWLRNVLITGDITPFGDKNTNFYAKDTLLHPQYPDSIHLPSKKPYYNNLDLYQFSRLNVFFHLNGFTILQKHFTTYLDGFAGIGRTWFNSRNDTTFRVNFWMYGASLTFKTKFPFFLNSQGGMRLFTVNPLTNGAYNKLNPQNSEINRNLNKDLLISNDQKYYVTFNLTLQIKVSKGADNSFTPSSLSTSSSADAIIFARLNYTTMLNSMWDPKLNYNNYYTIQIGYAGNVLNLLSGLKTALGL